MKILDYRTRFPSRQLEPVLDSPTTISDLTSSLKFSEIKKSADAEEMHVAAVSAKAENFMV